MGKEKCHHSDTKSHLAQEEATVVTSNRPSWLPWQWFDATITKAEGDFPKEYKRHKKKKRTISFNKS